MYVNKTVISVSCTQPIYSHNRRSIIVIDDYLSCICIWCWSLKCNFNIYFACMHTQLNEVFRVLENFTFLEKCRLGKGGGGRKQDESITYTCARHDKHDCRQIMFHCNLKSFMQDRIRFFGEILHDFVYKNPYTCHSQKQIEDKDQKRVKTRYIAHDTNFIHHFASVQKLYLPAKWRHHDIFLCQERCTYLLLCHQITAIPTSQVLCIQENAISKSARR